MRLTIEGRWVKIYAGNWSLLTVSYLGVQHTRTIRKRFGIGPHNNIIITNKWHSVSYYKKDELKTFGGGLAARALSNGQLIRCWCDEVKNRTDSLKALMKMLYFDFTTLGPTFDKYQSYLKEIYDYAPSYVAVKQVANFLPKEELEKYLPLLDETRLYTETLYTKVEEFMCSLAEYIEKATECPAELVLCCQKDEFEAYLKRGLLPPISILKERFESGAQIFTDGRSELIIGDQ